MEQLSWQKFRAGEVSRISATVLTMRDASLARIAEEGRSPVDLQDALVFFCGPTPTPPGKVTGALGPTTTQRMVDYFPMLLDMGVRGILGKGEVDEQSAQLFQDRAVLWSVVGGVSAFLAQHVRSSEIIAFSDLGAEAIWQLELFDFPVLTVVDSRGENFFTSSK